MSEASKLEFDGIVEIVGEETVDVKIGGRFVVSELEDLLGFEDRPAKVTLWAENAKSVAEGDLHAREGEFGYGTYTPGYGADVWVGDVDLLEKLEDLAGFTVAMLVEVE